MVERREETAGRGGDMAVVWALERRCPSCEQTLQWQGECGGTLTLACTAPEGCGYQEAA